ncbi:MAG: ABC transporter substrate-binding protein [Spirochaetota bacterium]
MNDITSRRRVVFGAFLALFLIFQVAATGIIEDPKPANTTSSATRVVQDGLGRSVSIPVNPQRIVTAGRAVLMIADALYLFPGASERIVGVGRINQGKGNFLAAIDPNYGEKAQLERNVGPEQIVALEPDLVILKSTMREQLGVALEQIGVPVIYLELETPKDYQEELVFLGDVLGQPERGATLAAYYATLTERVRDAATDRLAAADAPRTLFLYASQTGGDIAFDIPPASWIQTRLVEIAGGHAVWASEHRAGGWRTIGFEQIAAWDPDIITLVAYRQDVSAIRNALVEQPLWQALSALPDSLFIFPLDFYSWDQPDVRWILGLQWLSSLFDNHVGREPEIEVIEAMYEFFATGYGLSREDVDAIIVPVLEGVEPATR